MSVRALLFYYWGFTRCLTMILCITLAWTPFAVVWADAIQAAGSDGQQTGQQLLGAFQFPVDTGRGAMTLNPGTNQESTLTMSTLFPDSGTAGSTTVDLPRLYGNNPDTLAAGLKAQTTLNGETSATGEAYRTLTNNAHQSHPDLQHDPLWDTGDQVFAHFTPWAKSFSDCTTTTTQTATTKTVAIPDYQLCLRQHTVPQSCSASHQVNVEPLLTYVSGNGGLSSCGPGCLDLYVGVVGNDYWSTACSVFTWQATYNVLHPEAIISATLEEVVYDDHTRVYYDGSLLYNGSTGWGLPCDLNNLSLIHI